MSKLILTIGVSASGKTTWAEQQTDCVNLNRDDIRQELFGPFKWGEYNFTKDNETKVTELQASRFLTATKEGKDVIISDTNLSDKTRSKWEGLAQQTGYSLEYEVFHTTLQEALERDAARTMSVGKDVLTKQYRSYQTNCKDLIVESFKGKLDNLWKETSSRLFVCDLDGTIAYNNGHRGWFDWHKVGKDEVKLPMQTIIQNLNLTNEQIIFMSGRDEVCREETEDWLEYKAEVQYDKLLMRPQGDYRPDWLIKLELLEQLPFRPLICFDDRDQVVEVFREIGLTVFQVEQGNF